MPYEHVGACPFECCTYRTWVTRTSTKLRGERSGDASVVVEESPEEEVVALTGVVVTTIPGRALVVDAETVNQSLNDSSLPLKAGDEVLLLHYEGEGMWLAWFRGNTLSLFVGQTPGSMWGNGAAPEDLKIESWPETKWWVQIQTSSGQVGWCDEPGHFDGKDACA